MTCLFEAIYPLYFAVSLTQLLNASYPMSKVDLLAIPDFYYGAMENWGLVTFRESALLYHPSESTSASKMSVLNIIAHELAHFVSAFEFKLRLLRFDFLSLVVWQSGHL